MNKGEQISARLAQVGILSIMGVLLIILAIILANADSITGSDDPF